MNKQIARATKLFWPNMAQVTAVRSPSGLNVNSAVLVPAIGCTKSSLILMSSAGRLWVTVMRPSPISLLPAQAKTAPSPADGPSKVVFALGSSFAQGDHASHLWKSLTCAKTSDAGAAIVADRAIRYSEGCSATNAANAATIATRAIRIFSNIETPLATPLMRAVSGAQASTMIIQPTPKRSATMPKRLAKNVLPSGIRTSPPSASAANTRSASSSLALTESEKPSNFGLPWAQPSDAITDSPLMLRHECMILLSLPGATLPGGG